MKDMCYTPANLKRVVFNLIALIGMGLSITWWVLYFTDYFPVVLGLLGLGGFFAWIAFLINILSEDRRKQLQQRVDELFLQKKMPVFVIIGILAIGWLGVAPIFGTLIIDSLEPIKGHVVEIRPAGSNKTDHKEAPIRIPLPPSSKTKVLLFTNWFGARDYYVKVSGYPNRRVSVTGIQRYTLLLPDMLLERPVILARPEARFAGPVSSGYNLQVLLNKELVGEIKDYIGQSVWIGTDDDVVIPDHLLNEWRQEFRRSKLNPEGITIWTRPLAVASALEFQPGAEVTVQLVLRSDANIKNPTVKYSNTLKVSTSGKSRSFPEELVIMEAKNDNG